MTSSEESSQASVLHCDFVDEQPTYRSFFCADCTGGVEVRVDDRIENGHCRTPL